ncbi:MAG: hypothetical protein LBU80_05535 [Rikenellaceae bacterium]|jgi:hypothetical protein|nr:hypothetical protein [Rikenellaceae bacterium]
MRNLRFRTTRWLNNLLAFRHWRGRAIHSPFMYGLVRRVWIERRMTLEEYLGCPLTEAGDTSPDTIEAAARDLLSTRSDGLACLVVCGVDRRPERYGICRKIRSGKYCVSVDRYKTWYFFFDPKLRPQHYKIRCNSV